MNACAPPLPKGLNQAQRRVKVPGRRVPGKDLDQCDDREDHEQGGLDAEEQVLQPG